MIESLVQSPTVRVVGWEEQAQRTWVISSFIWKFLWQPHVAQVIASRVPSAPLATNSVQPSTTCPPILHARFLQHFPYFTCLTIVTGELLEHLLLPSLRRITLLIVCSISFNFSTLQSCCQDCQWRIKIVALQRNSNRNQK